MEDLSPAERRQVAAGRANISAGGTPCRDVRAKHDPGKASRPAGNPIWQCHDCGQQFTALETAQRHCDTEKHRRLDWLLP